MISSAFLGISDYLCKQIYIDLNLGRTERVTCYRAVANEENLKKSGRYSERPELRYHGREEIPRNQGYVGSARENSDRESFYRIPSKKKKFEEFCKGQKLDSAIIQKLAMRPRIAYCFCFHDHAENDIVLVIESTKPTAFTKDDAREVCRKKQLEIKDIFKEIDNVSVLQRRVG